MPAPWETEAATEAPPWETESAAIVKPPEPPEDQTPTMPAARPPTNLSEALAVTPPDLRTPEQWGQQTAIEQRAAALPITAPLDQATTEQIAGSPGPLVTLPEAPPVEEIRRLPGEAMLGDIPTESVFGTKGADIQAQLQRSIYNAAKSVPEFFSTEEGMLAGLASLTPLGKVGVTTYFTLDMAKSVLDQAKKMGEDWDQIGTLEKTRRLTQALATLGFTGLLAKAGVSEVGKYLPTRALRPTVEQPPWVTGEELPMPEGYMPRPKIQPPRPVVPGEPAESRVVPTPEQEALIEEQQQIKTVRAAKAMTKAQVQALFPDMNRQQAAQLRDKVWGAQTPEPTETPPAEPPPIEPTPPTTLPIPKAVAPVRPTRLITETELENLTPAEQGTLGHGNGIEYGVTLDESSVPDLEAKYKQAAADQKEAFQTFIEMQSPEFQAGKTPEELAKLTAENNAQQLAAGGKMAYYGGALMGASRGEHPISGANYAAWVNKRVAEGKPVPEPRKPSPSAAPSEPTPEELRAELNKELGQETEKPAATPKDLALQAQRDAGWDPKWPFVPADFGNKTFREGIESDPTLSPEVKDSMFSAAEKLLGGKIERTKPSTPETQPVETPIVAADKVETQVSKVAVTRGQRPAKEIKADYIGELEKAIETAKSEEDYPGLKMERNAMERSNYIPDEEVWKKAKKEIGTVTIDIPGDGITTILNTKEALQAVLTEAKKIKTTPGAPVKKVPTGGETKVSDDAKAAAQAYGSPEAAYQSARRQLRQLQEQEPPRAAEDREEWNNQIQGANALIYELYHQTKAGKLDAQAEAARDRVGNYKVGAEGFETEIARLEKIKRKTQAHKDRLEDLKERYKQNQDFISTNTRNAEQLEQQADKEKAALEAEPKPSAPASEETPLGFGGGVKPPKPPVPPAADPTPVPNPVTPEESAAVQTRKTPGLLTGIAQGIKSLLLPSSKGSAQLKAAELLGSKLGPMHQRAETTGTNLRPFSRAFDKLGVHREDLAPADNPGIRFMSDMSQGRPMEGWRKAAGEMVERMFAGRLRLLEEAGAELQSVRENYFPGMWTRESRLAFNAVMERMGKDFDPAKATPEQKAAIREQVDKMISSGTGSDKDAMGFLTRKPLAGRESFRKQKVFDDIMDGAELGLRPISNNPMDLVQLKLAEMDKSVMAHQYFQVLKERGELKIISPYEEVPQGWVKLNDKYGTIYGPPTVTIPEYVDRKVYEGLLKVASDLGIKHERLMQFPRGPGNQALGLSYQGQNRILSRFGTETSVIAHEIGHQLDVKYDLWKRLTGGGTGAERSVEQKQLRAIAEETERGRKSRSKEEKMAQVMEIYIHAPERMKEIAPRIYSRFNTFIQETPELRAFSEIKPGIALKQMASEKYVGLPILGYRIVPEAHAEIANNYLSSSLYNNKYFGSLYKGWMSTANALNQTQLGMGSAFHAGFTTGEAQISSGANVLKDIYGVLRGNRSPADLGKSIVKNAVGTIRNPVIGDQVLNAWRYPDGQIDPRIAQVVRAAELAGGGFKLETGLRTEQSIKALRDWYSGNRLRAAARSPIALVELLAKPTMDLLVPRQKAGVFADLAWRIIEQNPGKSLEELTPQFRQAWNRVDARLGQVRYDRLFINNTAKNVVQGLVRAPGWSGGTIAEIGGGFTDAGKFMSEWVKTGKLPENLPDRTAYVISLLTTVGAINAALTYAFTGDQPHGMDFFSFRTGNKDERGREERFLIPSYVKDMLAYARHPMETLTGKGHPLIQMLSDIARNKDYYGVEIRNPDSSIPSQAGQMASYVAKGFEPFWTRGTRREVERGASPFGARTIAPFFGVMPAPRSVTQTPAENLAHDLMLQQIPVGARTQAQAERARLKAATAPKEDYLLRVIKRLNATAAVRVYQKANEEERAKIRGEVASKIGNAKSLTEAEKSELRQRMSGNIVSTVTLPPWE